MRLHIEPQPTPHDAAAIAAALEELFARPDTGKELSFNDAALSDPLYPRPRTWRDVARIEALTSGV
jgi:tRNA G37 N-methylase TrmD